MNATKVVTAAPHWISATQRKVFDAVRADAATLKFIPHKPFRGIVAGALREATDVVEVIFCHCDQSGGGQLWTWTPTPASPSKTQAGQWVTDMCGLSTDIALNIAIELTYLDYRGGEATHYTFTTPRSGQPGAGHRRMPAAEARDPR